MTTPEEQQAEKSTEEIAADLCEGAGVDLRRPIAQALAKERARAEKAEAEIAWRDKELPGHVCPLCGFALKGVEWRDYAQMFPEENGKIAHDVCVETHLRKKAEAERDDWKDAVHIGLDREAALDRALALGAQEIATLRAEMQTVDEAFAEARQELAKMVGIEQERDAEIERRHQEHTVIEPELYEFGMGHTDLGFGETTALALRTLRAKSDAAQEEARQLREALTQGLGELQAPMRSMLEIPHRHADYRAIKTAMKTLQDALDSALAPKGTR